MRSLCSSCVHLDYLAFKILDNCIVCNMFLTCMAENSYCYGYLSIYYAGLIQMSLLYSMWPYDKQPWCLVYIVPCLHECCAEVGSQGHSLDTEKRLAKW